MRSSSPPSIRLRRIWSSQTLTPASVSAARRSFTWTLTLISPTPGSHRVEYLATELGGALGRDPEVRVHILRGAGRPERRHAEESPVGADPLVPPNGARGLNRHARAARRRQHLVPVRLVRNPEGVHARHGHDPR